MKRVEHSHLTVVAQTDEGARGKKNEDRYGVAAFQRKDRRKTPVLLAVLADGIGGHRAGEVAADLAVNQISAYIASAAEDLPPVELLQGAVRAASQMIHQHASAAPERQGMGATCAVAYVIGTCLFAANVGDSRIYLLRGGQLHQLSTDHTWIQEALDNGLLSEDQIKGHPNAHIIRRFLGSAQPPEAAIRLQFGSALPEAAKIEPGIPLQKDDILLLCSDGLTDLVSNDEISAVVSSQGLEAAAGSLIDLANQRGGHDNITLILMQVPKTAVRKNGRVRKLFWAGCLSFIAILVLAAAVLYGTGWFSREASATATATLEWTLPPLATSALERTPSAPTAALPVASAYPGQELNPPDASFATEPSGATMTPWPTNPFPAASAYP